MIVKPNPKEGVRSLISRTIDSQYGILAVPALSDDMITRFLRRYGEWAFLEAKFLALNVADDARILDIGAFLGTFSLGVASLRRLGAVCMVEANPSLFDILQHNAQCCVPPPIVLNAVVVGEAQGGDVRAAWQTAGNLGSLSFVANEVSEAREEIAITAPALALPELRERNGPFDLIKIDAEGMELDILRGDPELMAHSDASIWLECNEDPRSLTLAAAMLDAGFRVFYFAFSSFRADNYLRDPDPVFPFAFEAGLFCSRDCLPVLDDELRANGCVLARIEAVEDLRTAMWRTPRGGPREWLSLSSEAVVAVAGHAVRGESFDHYLRPELRGADIHATGTSEAEPETSDVLLPAEAANEVVPIEPLLEEVARQQRRIEELESEVADLTWKYADAVEQRSELQKQLDITTRVVTRVEARLARVQALADGRGVLLTAANEQIASLRADPGPVTTATPPPAAAAGSASPAP